jgi:hypothetical protein
VIPLRWIFRSKVPLDPAGFAVAAAIAAILLLFAGAIGRANHSVAGTKAVKRNTL